MLRPLLTRTSLVAAALAALTGCAGGAAPTSSAAPAPASGSGSASVGPATASGTARPGEGRVALVGFGSGDLVTGVLVADLATSTAARLGGEQEAWSPAWIDGGERLALVRRTTSEAPGQLVTTRADGSGGDAAVDATAQVLEARSTPDGGRLVWIGRSEAASPLCDAPPPSEPLGLYTAESAGGETPDGTGLTGVRRVADLPATASGAVPSPDGRTVAWVDLGETTGACDGGDARLVLLDLATGAQRVVSGTPQRLGVPRWSPDGRTIALDGDDFATGQTRDVVLVDVPSATARRLVTPGTVESAPVFSPDGRHLAFLRHDDGARGLASAAVVLADAAGGGPRVLALTGTDDEDLVWTRDGSRLVVSGARIEPACEAEPDTGTGADAGGDSPPEEGTLDGGCDVAGADPGVRTVDVATGALHPLPVTAALLQSGLTVAP